MSENDIKNSDVFNMDFLKNLGIDLDNINLILSEAKKIQSEFDIAKSDYNKLLSDVQREKIHSALQRAGAKSIIAAESLIDKNNINFDGISVNGLDEEITRLKKENNFLFQSDSMPYVVTATNKTDGDSYALRQIMGL